MRHEFGRGLVILPFPGALIIFLRQESRDFSFSDGLKKKKKSGERLGGSGEQFQNVLVTGTSGSNCANQESWNGGKGSWKLRQAVEPDYGECMMGQLCESWGKENGTKLGLHEGEDAPALELVD